MELKDYQADVLTDLSTHPQTLLDCKGHQGLGIAFTTYCRDQPVRGMRTPAGALRKANGFKNCRRQNRVRSTSLKLASSQTACQACSMAIT